MNLILARHEQVDDMTMNIDTKSFLSGVSAVTECKAGRQLGSRSQYKPIFSRYIPGRFPISEMSRYGVETVMCRSGRDVPAPM